MILTSADADWVIGPVLAGSGIVFAPAETLTVIKSEPSTETPTAAEGEVVCSPRLSVRERRFLILSLKPELALQGN